MTGPPCLPPRASARPSGATHSSPARAPSGQLPGGPQARRGRGRTSLWQRAPRGSVSEETHHKPKGPEAGGWPSRRREEGGGRKGRFPASNLGALRGRRETEFDKRGGALSVSCLCVFPVEAGGGAGGGRGGLACGMNRLHSWATPRHTPITDTRAHAAWLRASRCHLYVPKVAWRRARSGTRMWGARRSVWSRHTAPLTHIHAHAHTRSRSPPHQTPVPSHGLWVGQTGAHSPPAPGLGPFQVPASH